MGNFFIMNEASKVSIWLFQVEKCDKEIRKGDKIIEMQIQLVNIPNG